MTKIPKPIDALYIANILKKSMKCQIRGYENSIIDGSEDNFTSLCRTLKDIEGVKLKAVEYLIDFIKTEHRTKCRHPKKLQDIDPNRIVYCMKCGEDV